MTTTTTTFGSKPVVWLNFSQNSRRVIVVVSDTQQTAGSFVLPVLVFLNPSVMLYSKRRVFFLPHTTNVFAYDNKISIRWILFPFISPQNGG